MNTKLYSGRFWLTIIAGFTFSYMSIAGKLDPNDALTVILLIVGFYFGKSRDNDKVDY